MRSRVRICGPRAMSARSNRMRCSTWPSSGPGRRASLLVDPHALAPRVEPVRRPDGPALAVEADGLVGRDRGDDLRPRHLDELRIPEPQPLHGAELLGKGQPAHRPVRADEQHRRDPCGCQCRRGDASCRLVPVVDREQVGAARGRCRGYRRGRRAPWPRPGHFVSYCGAPRHLPVPASTSCRRRAASCSARACAGPGRRPAWRCARLPRSSPGCRGSTYRPGVPAGRLS